MRSLVVDRDGAPTTVIAAGLALLIIGTLFEVPAVTLTVGLIAVAVQTWLGSEIYRRIIGTMETHVDELIGMGFALGSLLVVTIDQALVRTPLRDFWWWTLPLVASALAFSRKRAWSGVHTQFNLLLVTERTLWICTFSMFVLVQERYWPLWIALALLAASVCLRQLRFTSGDKKHIWLRASIAALTGTVIVTWRVVDWRPSTWWIKTADIQFFEALGFSVSHFGAQDQVFAVGEPIKYHWLSYAWTGMLDRISGSEPWVVISRLAPVVVAIALYFLTSAVARHMGLRGRWLAFTLAIFALLNDFNFESFSMVFSYVWLLSAFVSAVHIRNSTRRSMSLLFVALATAAFAAKSSNIVVVVGLLATATFTCAASLAVTLRRGLLLTIATVGSSVAAYLYFFAGSGYSELVEFGVSGFAQDLFGDLRSLSLWPRTTAAVIVLTNALIIFVFSSVVLLDREDNYAVDRSRRVSLKPQVTALVACLLGSALVLAVFVAPFHEQEEYFLHSLAVIGTFGIATAIQSLSDRRALNVRLVRLATTASVALTTLLVLLTPTNDGTTFAMFVRVLIGSPVFLVGLAMFVVLSGLWFGRIIAGRQVVACLLIAALASSVVASNDQWVRRQAQFKAEIQSAEHQTRYLGGEDVIAGAALIRERTVPNAIIASNHFCERTWCPTDEYLPTRSNWLRGGEALGLVVYSERRFFVSGYGFTWQNIKPPAEIVRRIQWSLNPQLGPPKTDASVRPSYFMRDLTMPCRCDDLGNAVEVGRTPRFVLYQLNS
jgi:hypothetical protein